MDFGNIILILIWTLLWGFGGILIIANLFSLEKEEIFFAGLAAGLITENWLANILGQWMPTTLAFWIASMIVFIAGAAFAFRYWKTFRGQIRGILLPRP